MGIINKCIRAFIHSQATAGITTAQEVPGDRVTN